MNTVEGSPLVANPHPYAPDGAWVTPGPGLWERDPAHQERPFCRLWFDVLPAAFARGTAEGFERLGLPLAELQVVDVNGWFYATMLPVDDAEFVARTETAERALAERTWRTIAAEWYDTERSRFLARNRDLQATDPAGLATKRSRLTFVMRSTCWPMLVLAISSSRSRTGSAWACS